MVATYDHVQRGFIHYVIALAGAGLLAGALLRDAASGPFVPLVAGAGLMMALGGCFAHLRVTDLGDSLRVRFGPMGVFGTCIRYDNMVSAVAGRTTWLQGWGVHGFPFVSITYNIRGYECVTVTLKERRGLFRFRRVTIGTDDPEGLATFLSSKLSPGDGDAGTAAP